MISNLSLNISGSPQLSYSIYLTRHNNFAQVLRSLLPPSARVFILHDEVLAANHLPELKKALSYLHSAPFSISIKASEANKNLATACHLVDQLLEQKARRNDYLITLGGGIITDLGGLAASLTLRGVKLINLPTTLLAAVDSSIGGKNGVNHPRGKNLIGTFYNSCAVVINLEFLTTLPLRELQAGAAEIIKCGLIKSPSLVKELEGGYVKLEKFDLNFLQVILQKALEVKKTLVEQDFTDTKGQRALLNFGHTFGHAIEACHSYTQKYVHGEAVAIGMAQAMRFSVQKKILSNKSFNRALELIASYGLPTSLGLIDTLEAQNLVNLMGADKKNTGDHINLVLLQEIGQAQLYHGIKASTILDFLPTNA